MKFTVEDQIDEIIAAAVQGARDSLSELRREKLAVGDVSAANKAILAINSLAIILHEAAK